MGIISSMLSAIIYGFTPILARAAFDGGANGITATFFRGLLSIPILFIILKYKKISLSISKDWKEIFVAGVFGISLTSLSLYMSYSYISVSVATTLHFTYPILVSAACAILFKEKMNLWKISALILCSIGIFMFMDHISSFGMKGMALALLSGVTYSLYMICIDKAQLKHIHYFKLTLYLNLLMAVVSGLFGLYTGNLNFSLTPKAWILCAFVSFFTSLGALPLLQQGIKLTGASTAAILSTLEPITSIILGILILKETVSPLKLFGCSLIIISILLIAKGEGKQDYSDGFLTEKEDIDIET